MLRLIFLRLSFRDVNEFSCLHFRSFGYRLRIWWHFFWSRLSFWRQDHFDIFQYIQFLCFSEHDISPVFAFNNSSPLSLVNDNSTPVVATANPVPAFYRDNTHPVPLVHSPWMNWIHYWLLPLRKLVSFEFLSTVNSKSVKSISQS